MGWKRIRHLQTILGIFTIAQDLCPMMVSCTLFYVIMLFPEKPFHPHGDEDCIHRDFNGSLEVSPVSRRAGGTKGEIFHNAKMV